MSMSRERAIKKNNKQMKTIIIVTCAFLSLIISLAGMFLVGSYFEDRTTPQITGFVTEQESIS